MNNEGFLQFVWKQGLFRNDRLRTLGGEPVTVVYTGEQNRHAGPDFFNARIRIGNILWAGNVEVHPRASDWNRHGHHRDPAYNNVILHVVGIPDERVFNSQGRAIPCLVPDYPARLADAYIRFRKTEKHLPCSDRLQAIPPAYFERWTGSLLRERLQGKTDRILRLLEQKGGDWEETLYISLASGYGLPVNLLPFEMLASGLPLISLLEIRSNHIALEALLFGQAGLLDHAPARSPYVRKLREIYSEKKDRSMKPPVPGYLWKFLRLRPASFPTLRISQFADLAGRFPMLHEILNPASQAEMEMKFRTRASPYWENHYRFGKTSIPLVKYTGRQCILSLMINAVVPFLLAYGRKERNKRIANLGKDLLREAGAESNHVVKKWITAGFRPSNAVESQALIQLYHHYCMERRCLDCRLGQWCLKYAQDNGSTV